MNTESSVTEIVVRNHLQAFLKQKGIAAMLDDYDDNARFYSEAKIYQGEHEIHDFCSDFIGSLPAGGIDRFSLRSQRVDGNIAYITWSVGGDIPPGHRYFRRGQRQDCFTNVCHVCRAGSIDLKCRRSAETSWMSRVRCTARRTQHPVGFQNPRTTCDQRFQAAASY